MPTMNPQQQPSMDRESQQAMEEEESNKITGIPEVDAALMGIMKILPKNAAPQLEALVVALENTFNASVQQMPPGQEGVQ